jgi:hypothetical protein
MIFLKVYDIVSLELCGSCALLKLCLISRLVILNVICSSLNTPFLTSQLENLVSMKVVEFFSTFLTNSYLHFPIEYSGSYDFCQFAVRYC